MHSMSDFVTSASCAGVLMENLEAYMQRGVASPTDGHRGSQERNLPTVEGVQLALKELRV